MTKLTMGMRIPKTILFAVVALVACKDDKPAPDDTATSATSPDAAPAAATGPAASPEATAPMSEVERGKYLVNSIGCSDCHTPWAMGPKGPGPDETKLLSGHPQSLEMPPVPKLPAGPWLVVAGATNTAWGGPWGVSYTANLTPDPETGIGKWTKQNFIDTIKNGRRMGAGRPLLPPMPWENFANLTNEDLGAIYAYLMTIPPIENKVPEPRPPAGSKPAPAKK
jgi:mono/diheme cytochrome c family protein